VLLLLLSPPPASILPPLSPLSPPLLSSPTLSLRLLFLLPPVAPPFVGKVEEEGEEDGTERWVVLLLLRWVGG
jgi:hypothetical protein